MLCQNEKWVIARHKQDNILSKRTEIISKCRQLQIQFCKLWHQRLILKNSSLHNSVGVMTIRMSVRRYLSVKTRAVWKPVHRLALRCGGHGVVFNAEGYFRTDRHRLVCGSFSVFLFFFYQGFLSRTLITHRTAGEGRGPFFITLYHFDLLTNIQTLICNFACKMTITYF